jgi:hypothetical protein
MPSASSGVRRGGRLSCGGRAVATRSTSEGKENRDGQATETSRLKRPTPWPNGSGTGIGGNVDLVAPMTNIGRGLAERLLAQHPQLV